MTTPAYPTTEKPSENATSSPYLTKIDAAEKLGISPRRLVELAAAGHLKRRYSNGPNGRRIVLFDASAIAAFAERRLEGPAMRPPGEISTMRSVEPVMQQAATQIALLAELARIQNSQTATPQCDAVLWMTVDAAAGYSGLPESFLVAMIEAKKLPAVDVGVRKGGRWRIRRRDLEEMTAVRLTKR